MSVQTTLMIIADIGGYTRFIRQHRKTLVHAHLVIKQLLEAVINSVAKRFELSKIEGDAAFFYTTVKNDRTEGLLHLIEAAAAVHRAFHLRLAAMIPNTLCGCEACTDIDRLHIKVVAHIGQALFTRIRGKTELAGEDVIRVHRMLKNDVPISEYVLCTPQIEAKLPDDLRSRSHPITLHPEGLEDMQAYYLDLEALSGDLPESRQLPLAVRCLMYLWNNARALPFTVGIRKPLADFRNVAVQDESLSRP